MNEEPFTLPKWFSRIGICIVMFWIAWHFWSNPPFGDRFDSLSSLFSGLAFLGLLATLLYQRHELIITREIQKQSQEELAKTAEANRRSAEFAQNNLRMQYLFFWLQMNQERYTQLQQTKIYLANRSIRIELLQTTLDTLTSLFSLPSIIPRPARPAPEIKQAFGGPSRDPNLAEDARIPYFEQLESFLEKYQSWIDVYEKNMKLLEEISGIKMEAPKPYQTHS